MNPADFIRFFSTRTGKIIAFVIIFAAVLLVISSRRSSSPGSPQTVHVPEVDLGSKKSAVATFTKPIQSYDPPPLPPAVPASVPAPVIVTNIVRVEVPVPTPSIVLEAGPISLVPQQPQTPSKTLSETWAPFGRLIPCETVITVDSSSIQTPIIGLITQNVYHGGRLVIPAGTEVHGSAQTDRARERVASSTSWRLVWQTGQELSLKAIALDREFSNTEELTGWGITDGSAGLRGRLIKSDDMAEIKLFAATLLSGAASAVTEKEVTIFGTSERKSLNNAPLAGARQVIDLLAQQVFESIQRDGFFVRIPSGKQFYLYVLQPIDTAEATLGGQPNP